MKEKFERFECTDCGKIFFTEDVLEEHAQRKHGVLWLVSTSREEIEEYNRCEHDWQPELAIYGFVKRCTKCKWVEI